MMAGWGINKLPLFFATALLVFSSCVHRTAKIYLDNGFELRWNLANELEKLQESVKLVSGICYYRGYILSESLKITTREAKVLNMGKFAVEKFYFNKNRSGSSVVIYSDADKVLLVTCAHVIDFPDTLMRCYSVGRDRAGYVEAISYKEKQELYITELDGYDSVGVLLIDRGLDIAFLLVHISEEAINTVQAIGCPYGNSSKLKLGSRVYIIGYPGGYKMISSGVIGRVGSGAGESIVVDAPFNRGASGGAVVAIREDGQGLELIGLARSASAEFLEFLVPAESYEFSDLEKVKPYSGEVYVERHPIIRYGITLVIPINRIIEYMKEHADTFKSKGIGLNLLKL